ncbi:hypothetical protein Scep_029984 [Stephania cephalantha]|uniref:Uncharacterized protein n=1 Tax=Stephania cephalantha TaxID=152367 RepID=A0AAP0E6I0_9MAGN
MYYTSRPINSETYTGTFRYSSSERSPKVMTHVGTCDTTGTSGGSFPYFMRIFTSDVPFKRKDDVVAWAQETGTRRGFVVIILKPDSGDIG